MVGTSAVATQLANGGGTVNGSGDASTLGRRVAECGTLEVRKQLFTNLERNACESWSPGRPATSDDTW